MPGMMKVAQSDGLTALEVLRDIPHDAGAVIVYVLIAGFVAAVWLGSRRRA